ncbi:MAG: DAK2 domain-containing protein [Clostridia bacterium]|nr:DAK2 domain-containing protein [Clostridia bacterium]
MNKHIDGKSYSKMLLGGASALLEHAQEVNDLNVFPVPDGDTGTNMAKTLEGGIAKLSTDDTDSIGEASKSFSNGVLLGARGNSGVILSQIFAGINEELSKYDVIDAKGLAEAYKNGIKKSYSAVQNPTEGTILTVFRESTEYAAENIDENSTIEDFFKLHIEKAKESLAKTKELLPVLAEADVVDSGGAGYLYIAIGMYEVLTGKSLPSFQLDKIESKSSSVNIDMFTRDSVLEFGYCTEFLLRLTTNKVDPDNFDMNQVLDILNELGGESIVAYQTGDIVKVHVHTFTPGLVLTRIQEFGEFLTVKIENMSVSHSGTPEKKSSNGKSFSVLTVASGEGMCSLFTDMGADLIVAGGQSANPSTEEFIEAFNKCDTPNILVLPNNKNVFLAANQAAEIYKNANVHIIPTKSLMQGYGALSVITPGITDIEMLVENATRAANSLIGSEITRAVRNVTINGKEIKENDYIAITDGQINVVSDSAKNAVLAVLEDADMDEYEIVTLFVGKNISETERAELTEKIEDLYPDCEVIVYEGGQDVYDYLIAIE